MSLPGSQCWVSLLKFKKTFFWTSTELVGRLRRGSRESLLNLANESRNTVSSVSLRLQLDYCSKIVFPMKILLCRIHLMFFDLQNQSNFISAEASPTYSVL